MKKTILSIIIAVLIVIISVTLSLINRFAKETNTPFSYFSQQLISAIREPSLSSGFSFVILGVDPRDDILEKTQVSDSIMIGRITPDWKVNLVSIPRDLWVYSLDTKVNQIYPLSMEKSPGTIDYKYVQYQFSQLTGQDIEKTLLITTNNLIGLTKLLGGVDVVLESTYTDEEYPNPEYIKDPEANNPQYITVIFKKGKVHLDESNITQFVRSRKGQNEDGTGGTDIGRIKRQQLLLDALLVKLRSADFIQNPQQLVNLYNFWKNNITSNFSDHDLISLVIEGRNKLRQVSLNRTNIPASEEPIKDVIYHPKYFENREWVYIPKNKDYTEFREYISKFLHQ